MQSVLIVVRIANFEQLVR